MVSLDDKVRALAVTAGWKTPRPEQDGSYSFQLEDGLDLKLFPLTDAGVFCWLICLPCRRRDMSGTACSAKWRGSRPASAVSALRSWPLSGGKMRLPGAWTGIV